MMVMCFMVLLSWAAWKEAHGVITHQLVKVNGEVYSFHCIQVLALVKCPDLTPFNGDCHPSCQGSVGDSVTIACNSGFSLTGSNKMTCIETNTGVMWNVSTPKCLGKHF